MKGERSFLITAAAFAALFFSGASAKAQDGHNHSDPSKNPHQLPNGQYSNVPHPAESNTDYLTEYDLHPFVAPYPFDSALDTKIIGKVVPPSGEKEVVFHLRREPMPDKERKVSSGSTFLLLNDYLTPKRTFTKLLIKVLTNPPTDQFVGDTGWIELSHTSLYAYYDPTTNGIDTNFVYKKYVKAAAQFRAQSTTTACKENRQCLADYAKYYDCMAISEKERKPNKCKTKNCTLVDCPADLEKK
jgi:hypothetical protein